MALLGCVGWCLLGLSTACMINGADIGYCEKQIETDASYRSVVMPFCGEVVTYTACLPKFQPVPASREFPEGRFNNNSVSYKDSWVQKMYEEVVVTRRTVERSKALKKAGVDENGMRGDVYPRFTKHKDCYSAFKNYFCWINFPRCDDQGQSLMMCRSACENYFKACHYNKDMWRCGAPELFNGYKPEKPHKKTGQFLRDFFPGQPFRSNQFNKKNNPVVVCTPSIKNPASRRHPMTAWLVGALTVAMVVLVAWL